MFGFKKGILMLKRWLSFVVPAFMVAFMMTEAFVVTVLNHFIIHSTISEFDLLLYTVLSCLVTSNCRLYIFFHSFWHDWPLRGATIPYAHLP